MVCACNAKKGTWKVYKNGAVVKSFGSTDADEVRAKTEARRVGGTARKG